MFKLRVIVLSAVLCLSSCVNGTKKISDAAVDIKASNTEINYQASASKSEAIQLLEVNSNIKTFLQKLKEHTDAEGLPIIDEADTYTLAMDTGLNSIIQHQDNIIGETVKIDENILKALSGLQYVDNKESAFERIIKYIMYSIIGVAVLAIIGVGIYFYFAYIRNPMKATVGILSRGLGRVASNLDTNHPANAVIGQTLSDLPYNVRPKILKDIDDQK